MPFCNPPKNQSHLLHHCLSVNTSIILFYLYFFSISSPNYVGSFGFFFAVVLVRDSQRKQGNNTNNKESKEISPLLLYSSSSSFFICPWLVFFSPLYYFPPHLSFFTTLSSYVSHLLLFSLSLSLSLSLLLVFGFWVFCKDSFFVSPLIDLMMKKMKGVVAVEPSSYALYEDSRARFKHQSLMQDYQELQKDSEAMKMRLEMMKKKRSNLTAEVRFLRRRYKYLIEKKSKKPKPKQDLVQTHNSKLPRANIPKGKKNIKRESGLRHPAAPAVDLNQKVRINNAMEVALQKSTPNSDLSHRAKTVSWKETTLHNSNPVIDLNQKDTIQSGKESTKRKNTPIFDLNQVSLEEEEEVQLNCEPLRTEEPNKSILRGGIDEHDMKLLVCRTIGNGPNRSGKRKITWQDQVALRV